MSALLQDQRDAEKRLARARRGLLLPLAILVLCLPLGASVEDIASYSHLAPGPRLYGALAAGFVLDGLLPGLVVSASLVALLPTWQLVRVALPSIATIALLVWAAWFWLFFGTDGKFPNYPLADMRWSLVAAGPLGLVTATSFIFLLAKARLAGRAPRVS